MKHLKRDAFLSGLFLLSAPFVGLGLYRLTHHRVEGRPSTTAAPPSSASSKFQEDMARIEREGRLHDEQHAALMKKKQEGLDDRWDKCVAAHGLPVPGFSALDDRERWGLMCIRPQSVIYINDTAW